MMTTKRTIEIDIRRHERYDASWTAADVLRNDYWRAIVTTRKGFSYSCVWAGDKPSEETIADAWKMDRKAFAPYYSGV